MSHIDFYTLPPATGSSNLSDAEIDAMRVTLAAMPALPVVPLPLPGIETGVLTAVAGASAEAIKQQIQQLVDQFNTLITQWETTANCFALIAGPYDWLCDVRDDIRGEISDEMAKPAGERDMGKVALLRIDLRVVRARLDEMRPEYDAAHLAFIGTESAMNIVLSSIVELQNQYVQLTGQASGITTPVMAVRPNFNNLGMFVQFDPSFENYLPSGS